MSRIKLSIAMATYNGAMYLREQLDSFATQTRLPDELVICDDGSTDDTLAILEEFADQAPFRVCIHRNDRNLGYIKNFDKAISLTSGDLIFLSDQDDVWFPTKLATFERRAGASHVPLLFVCDQILCGPDLAPGIAKSENFRRLGVSPSSLVTGCCTAIRRELLHFVCPIPSTGIPHDSWIHFVARQIGRREYIDEPLQMSRRHGANASSEEISNPEGIAHPSFYRSAIRHYRAAKKNAFPAMLAKLEEMKILDVRLQKYISERIEFMDHIAIERARLDMRFSIYSLEKRVVVAQLPLVNRIIPITQMLREGVYSRHNGIRSAIKDLVRCRSATLSKVI